MFWGRVSGEEMGLLGIKCHVPEANKDRVKEIRKREGDREGQDGANEGGAI